MFLIYLILFFSFLSYGADLKPGRTIDSHDEFSDLKSHHQSKSVDESDAEWLRKGNLREVLEVEPVTVVEIPLRINVFFLGLLDGTGLKGVKLGTEEVGNWLNHFSRIPNIISQYHLDTYLSSNNKNKYRRARSQHSVESRSHDSSWHDEKISNLEPQVKYSYHYNLLELDPAVLRTLEVIIARHTRPVFHSTKETQENKVDDDSAGSWTNIFQVDVEVVTTLLDDLADFLGLARDYNFFIMSPKPPWQVMSNVDEPIIGTRPVYGYRNGFSEEEVEKILLNTRAIPQLPSEVPETANILSGDPTHNPPKTPIDRHKIFTSSKDWAKRIRKLEPGSMFDGYLADILHRKDQFDAMAGTFEGTTLEEHFGLSHYINRVKNLAPTELRDLLLNKVSKENCLVDNWIGRGRTLFLDLSAGPFNWGPTVGGEGVRTNHSRPNLESFSNSTYSLASAKHSALAKQTVGVPGGATIQQQTEQTEEETVSEETLNGYVDGEYDYEAIAEEKRIIEEYLSRPICKDLSHGLHPDCAEYQKALDEINAFLKLEAEKHKNDKNYEPIADAEAPPADPHHSHDPLQTTTAFSVFWDGHRHEHNTSLESEYFLSHLTSTMDLAVRHSLVPPLADPHLHFGWNEKVSFHLYVLANHELYDPLANGLADRFKQAMNALRLPGQSFRFSVHRFDMASDPALAMAFANGLRSTVLPILHHNGHFSVSKRLYLDSKVIESELSYLNMGDKVDPYDFAKGFKTNLEKGVRDIPIFLFSLDYPLPVLVDKYFQAKALPSMVIAVQSKERIWESHLQCNNKPIYWDLRDPLKALIQSTATLLGGLLPYHLGYSSSHHDVTQDWLWSVGDSPFSYTSQGIEFSQTNRDVLYRNYVLSLLREETGKLNMELKKLENQRTTLANRALYGTSDQSRSVWNSRKDQFHALYNLYSTALDDIYNVQELTEQLDFVKALQRVKELRDNVDSFGTAVEVLLTEAKTYDCAADTTHSASTLGQSLSSVIVQCLLVTLPISFICLLFYRRSNKPHIN